MSTRETAVKKISSASFRPQERSKLRGWRRRTDVVMHPIMESKTLRVRPVDCGKRALDPRPVTVTVVRHGLVGVLEPSVEHEPAVAHKVRRDVQQCDAISAPRDESDAK